MIIIRIWHKDLIPVLPRKQLLGQWRECCLIAKQIAEKGTPNHILVNRIMDYPINHFFYYASWIAYEMERRGYKVDFCKFGEWYKRITNEFPNLVKEEELFSDWHNHRYLKQCLYNLEEKYDCGGISKEEWIPIYDKFHYKNN